MISFNFETDFQLNDATLLRQWISEVISAENCKEGEINYVFCDDSFLHKLNLKFLHHDTLTDIISFDYSVGKELHGDIYISIDRVVENAEDYKVAFSDELKRVIIHGILHLCGYNDKSNEDIRLMRQKEDFYLNSLVKNS